MRIIQLDLHTRAAGPRVQEPPLLTSAILSRGYFPRRGLVHSILIHELAFLGLLNLPDSVKLVNLAPPRERAVTVAELESAVVMYLPVFRDDSQDALPEAAKQGARDERPRAALPPVASPQAKEGLSYPGRQDILSDFPKPTNFIQTVLQPELKDPPTLRPPVPLPNLVLTANTPLAQQSTPPDMVVPEDPPPVMPAATADANPVEPPPKIDPPPDPASLPKAEMPKVEPLERATAPPLPKNAPPPVPAPPWMSPPDPASLPRIEMPKVEPLARATAPPLPKNAPPPVPAPSWMSPPDPASLPRIEMPKVEPLVRATAPPLPKDAPPPVSAPSWMSTPDPASLPRIEMPKVEPLARATDAAFLRNAPAPRALNPPAPPPKTSGALKGLELPGRGTDPQNLLALTPMPAQLDQTPPVPVGEARGQFAISPKPNLAASTTEPGTKLATPPPAVETDRPAVNPASDAANGPAVKTAADSAKNKDSSNAVEAAARGTGSIVVLGSANSPGSGKATVPKAGTFPGITIVGGAPAAPSATGPAVSLRAPRPLQTAYELTAISTENSGGGLPSFGVFSQKQVYTVYLDMRQAETDTAASWTLEFAVLKDPVAQANTARTQQGLVLPFPAVKERPVLPTDLVRKYAGKMIIVYAVVNLEGKIEQISVKDSPDPQFNGPIVNALSKWLFRPALQDGDPVAAMVLIGIPLSLPE